MWVLYYLRQSTALFQSSLSLYRSIWPHLVYQCFHRGRGSPRQLTWKSKTSWAIGLLVSLVGLGLGLMALNRVANRSFLPPRQQDNLPMVTGQPACLSPVKSMRPVCLSKPLLRWPIASKPHSKRYAHSWSTILWPNFLAERLSWALSSNPATQRGPYPDWDW